LFIPNRLSERLIWAGLVVLFVSLRLPGLTRLPVFDDEAIYMNAAADLFHGGLHSACHEGKPLHVLLLAIATPWAKDPLWAGRFTSILVGLLGMLICGRLAERLFEERGAWHDAEGADGTSARTAGLFAMLFCCASPMLFFLNRMALPDGLLTTTCAAAMLWGWDLGTQPSRRNTVRFGVALALAVLSKPPGLLLVIAPLAANYFGRHPEDGASRGSDFMRAYGRAVAVAASICALPLVIFLRKNVEISKSVLTEQTVPLNELWLRNVRHAAEWLWFYWGPVTLLAGLGAMIWTTILYCRNDRSLRWRLAGAHGGAIYSACFTVIPIATFVIVARVWFSRYLGFTTLPLLALLAIVILQLPLRPALRIACGCSVGIAVLSTSWPLYRALWLDPPSASLPVSDSTQYITSWPSGYGTTEAAEWLKQVARNAPNGILVVRHAPDDAANKHLLRFLLRGEPGILIQNADLLDPAIRAGVSKTTEPVYVFGLSPTFAPAGARLSRSFLPCFGDRIARFEKPGRDVTVEIYLLRKQNCEASIQ